MGVVDLIVLESFLGLVPVGPENWNSLSDLDLQLMTELMTWLTWVNELTELTDLS